MTYKKIVEDIMNIINAAEKSDIGFTNICAYIDENCPELKENEDERVRKRLCAVINDIGGNVLRPYLLSKDKVLAWLEKQGGITKLSKEEQNIFAKGVLSSCAMSFINYLDAHKYEGKMCVSNSECEDIENAFHNAMWDKLHRYYNKYIEKQGEQPQGKSAPEAIKEEKVDSQNCAADKVKPKFKAGDWIIGVGISVNCKHTVFQVIEIKRGKYIIRDNIINHVFHIGIEECERTGRLWTIQDEKDGDVLVDVYGNIGIFEKYEDYYCWVSYCFMRKDGIFAHFKGTHTNEKTYPATKEQRDQFEKAMADVGYSFDFEKKELRKIDNK